MAFDLSDAQKAEFEARGVLTLDFGLDPALLDAVIEEVAPLYPRAVAPPHEQGVRVQDAWRQSEACRRLATDARVLAALEQLYGRTPRPFQTLSFPIGTSQAAHSDTVHFNSDPAGFVAGVWVALEDVDERNGALVYYPGSHTLPEYSMQDLGLAPSYGDYASYEERIGALIERHGLKPESGIVKKGQAVVWHGNLLHGGLPHADPARTRHSQVTHFFFDGCRYYTPMTSGRVLRTYRSPVWIPTDATPGRVASASLTWRVARRLAHEAKRGWWAVGDLARALLG